MEFQINKKDKRILLIKFITKILMNKTLDSISNRYEGVLINREGHNFPSEYVLKTDSTIYDFIIKNNIKYIIGVYNSTSIKHEELHAKYHLDSNYKLSIIKEWNDMEQHKREYIIRFLKKLGYSDKVLIDEYQAYKYSEKPNFFGIKI